MTVLSMEHVYKSYNGVDAVQDLSLELSRGEIFGLLGPNGAGKTTTIRMIMDIIMPDKGKISVLGKPNSQHILDRVGYLPEERGLYRKMKVGKQLAYLAELKGLVASQSKEKIESWLDRFEMLDWIDKKIEELSRGMQQKIQFIATLLHEPDLIILDEPFTGLDPINSQLMKKIMNEQKDRGAAIIFSTHLMEQVEKICDSICLIYQGKAVLNGELKKIKKDYSQNIFLIKFEGEATFLENRKLVQEYNRENDIYEIQPVTGVTGQKILEHAIKEVHISRFETMEPSLNEIFIETVKKRRGTSSE